MNRKIKENYPQDRLYHRDHTWVKFEKSNLVTFGITCYTKNLLGKIVELSPPRLRGIINYGSTCGQIESTSSALDLIAPASGVVETLNKALILRPSLLNDDPYENGWIARVKLENLYELAELVSASEYQNLLEEISISIKSA